MRGTAGIVVRKLIRLVPDTTHSTACEGTPAFLYMKLE
jgi:hypothetical protein